MSSALLTLRQRLNTTLPIHRLPVELLAMIMRHAAAYFLSGRFPWRRQLCDPQVVLTLSSVCTHWRSVALGSSSLWSTLDLSRHRLVSSVALLDVNITHRGLVPNLNTALQKQGPRIRTLHIRANDQDDPVLNILAFDAAQLRKIELICWDKPCIDDLNDDIHEEPLYLGGHLLGAPRLERLYMDQLVRVPANHFPTLCEIHLVCCAVPSLFDVINLLNNTPQLKYLTLHSLMVCRTNTPEAWEEAPVTLHSVQVINISLILSSLVVGLLSRLDLPPKMTLRLEAIQGPALRIPRLPTRLPIFDQLTRLKVTPVKRRCSVLALGVASALRTDMVKMASDMRNDANALCFHLGSLCIPLQQITELWISGDCVLKETALRLLLAMPSLVKISCNANTMNRICRDILSSGLEGLLAAPSVEAGPALRMLQCTISHGSSLDIGALITLLDLRIRLGKPIHHLHIVGMIARDRLDLWGPLAERVDSLVLSELTNRPRMELPAFCTEHSHSYYFEK